MGDGANSAGDGVLQILDGFYLDFDDAGDLRLQVSDDPSLIVNPSPESSVSSTAIRELERFLMDDGGDLEEVEQPLPDDFFADVLFAGSDDGSVDDATPPDDAAEQKSDEDSDQPAAGDLSPEENSEDQNNGEDSESKDEENEDNHRKKRTRQMRNRESAMKSRERKKMYVKDLEAKSKAMALEVKRLQHALHCCAAENMALRNSLAKAHALSAPLAVQESAVLFAESLLLGSLYWLVSIACLFLAPFAPLESSGAIRVKERVAGGDKLQSPGSQPRLISKNRSCIARRTRMKEEEEEEKSLFSSFVFPLIF